ncbi:MAG: hypothetical protein NVSMB25_19900 [Thermoleophilaceae bacterium]
MKLNTELFKRARLACISFILGLAALALVPSFASAAPIGALSQLAGTDGCIDLTGPAGSDNCTLASSGSIHSVEALVISPDGKNAYAVSETQAQSVAVFARDPGTGKLTQLSGTDGCVHESPATATCAKGHGLYNPEAVAISAPVELSRVKAPKTP